MARLRTAKKKALLPLGIGTLLLALVFLTAIDPGKLDARPVKSAELNLRERVVSGNTLTLNGSATHTRFIFPIYNVSLYLSHPATSSEQLLEQVFYHNEAVLIEMRFLMSLSARTFREGWSESFFENCATYCTKAEEDFRTLLAETDGFRRGDLLAIEIYHDLITIHFREKIYQSRNIDFAKALLLTWVGESPPSSSFKNALLAGPSNILSK